MSGLDQLTSHLGLWLLGLGLLTLLGIVLLWVWLRRHREKEDEAAGEAGGLAVAAAAPDEGTSAASLRGGEMTLSFLRAIKYLRAQATGRRRIYRVPWYLLLGQVGSGKTSIVQSLAHSRGGEWEGSELHHHLGWSFFDHGVVLDVPGEYVLDPYTLESQERNWRTLLRLLNRARPRRPVDGVVLTLPVEDFLPSSALSGSELSDKARKMADKLSHLQREAGECFPIYVLLTQCDRVPGFSSLCAQLPPLRRKEMFGWSSPYRADAGFEAQWVDEAFEEIHRALARVQSELYSEPEPADAARLFFFPQALAEVRERLRIFLQQVFRTTAYRDAYYCRGIYLTGAGPEALSEGGSRSAAGLLSAPGQAMPLAPGGSSAPPRPVFLDELFERKIFPEWGLAYPEARAFSFRRSALISWKSAALALAVLLTVSLGVGYFRLRRLQHQAMPLLASIRNNQSGGGEGMAGHLQLVRNVVALGDERFFSLAYPASWSLQLDTQVQEAVNVAFQRQVFDGIRLELIARAAAIAPQAASSGAGGGTGGEPAPGGTRLAGMRQFVELRQFTQQVEGLEDALGHYQHLTQANSPQPVAELNALMDYLHPGQVGEISSDDESFYARALAEATGQPVPAADIAAARARVRAGMRARVDALFSAWFEDNPGVAQLQGLADQIAALQQARHLSFAQLQELQTALQQADGLLHSPEAVWMSDPTTLFSGPMGEVTLRPVEHSANQPWSLFAPAQDLDSYIRAGAASGWQDLHQSLAGITTGLTGPLLTFGGSGAQLSPAVKALQLPLVNLLGLSFMAPGTGATFRATIPPGSSLTWNPGPLGNAATMVADYQRYVDEGLNNAPLAVRSSFRQIALTHLLANLDAQIAEAQTWAPASGAAVARQAEIQNFQAAAPQLRQLLQAFDHLGAPGQRARLLGLLNQQAFGLLNGIEQQLLARSAFNIQEGLASWDGSEPPLAAAFDLHGPDDLTNYLNYQRQRLVALAQAAQPLVEVLREVPAAGRSAAESALLQRWEAMGAAIEAYQSKQPGNPLSRLQDFITTDINKITPASHCQPAPPSTPLAGTGFLVSTRERLWRAVYARCRQLDQGLAHRDYASLAALFNRTLAGKFPFAAPAAAGTVEAEPSAIAAFYAQLERVKAGFGNQLGPGAATFVQTMEALRPVFASLLATPATAPVLEVTPTFRVNQGEELGGNQIIAWSLRLGSQVFRSGQPAASGHWTLGEPVEVQLQWAADSPRVPAATAPGGRRQPSVRGRTVTYTYDDPWSLLALVSQQRTPPADFVALKDTTPTTLAFRIPTAAAGTPEAAAPPVTLVFIRLAIKSPGTVESLRIPQFPARAPSEAVSNAGSHP